MTGTRRPSRLLLRRRLVLFSAPVMLIVLLAAVKMISVVVAGNSAVTNFTDRDEEALGRDTSTLSVLNVLEPAKAPFAAGTLAVLQGRLDEADRHFSDALARTSTEDACPALVNLELVRERQGDIDGWEGRPDDARERYRDALAVVEGCAGRLLSRTTTIPTRNDGGQETTRLPVWRPNWPASTTRRHRPRPRRHPLPHRHRRRPRRWPARPIPRDEPGELRLNPGAGDPTDKLRQILQDAAG